MDINKEMLMYILEFFDYYTEELVGNVIFDSKTDPHYSAVCAANHIKCFIQIMSDLGQELPYNDVKGYILRCGFSQEDCAIFEERYKNEFEDYNGKKF